jgi:actin-binding protein IPP
VLIHFLQSEHLRIENEFQVFQAALNWVLHELPKRRRYVFEILGPVRIPLISQKDIDRYIEQCQDLSLKIVLLKIVQDYKHNRRLATQLKLSKMKPFMLQPRKSARKSIFVIGGYSRDEGGRWSDSQSLGVVECFNTFSQQWKSITSLHHPRSGHGVAVLNGLVYVIGGESDSLIFDSAECFDPSNGMWTSTACMTVPRCGLGVCTIHNSIYAVGGWIGSEIGDTIERFDPALDQWMTVDKINTLRFAMGVLEYEGDFLHVPYQDIFLLYTKYQ